MQLLPGQLDYFKTPNEFAHVMELLCGMKLTNTHTSYNKNNHVPAGMC